MQILFAAAVDNTERWLELLRRSLPNDRVLLPSEVGDPSAIEVALVAGPTRGALAGMTRLKLLQSLWMGVDGLLADPTLPRQVPLARCIDPGMIAAMRESVLAHVLDHHRHHHHYRRQQAERLWDKRPQLLASERQVGLLGLGELGTPLARALVSLGFRVRGFSRRPRAVADVECFSGPGGLEPMLSGCDVAVCLLPLTAETRGILNAGTLARLREGAAVVNVARGAHVVEADLIAALDSGRLAHAYLDVFETEPLRGEHPFWEHPAVTITPHTAALTEPRTATAMIAENVRRIRRGEPARALVDRAAGY